MARRPKFIMGSYYRTCDRTGFVVRVEDTRKQWDNLIVRKESWEARHPQDFVRGVPDYMVAPEARPMPEYVFVQTTVLLTQNDLGNNPHVNGYGPPLLTQDGSLIYVQGPPGDGEVPPITQDSYPRSW